MRRCTDRSEHGAAAVELTLVLLPLLLLLVGIVEFSRAFYIQWRMQEAAGEAARVVALHDPLTGGLIGPIVNTTLHDTLGSVMDGADDFVVTLNSCSPTNDTASVAIRRSVTLALPLPDNVGWLPENAQDWNTVSVGGTARMPCEA